MIKLKNILKEGDPGTDPKHVDISTEKKSIIRQVQSHIENETPHLKIHFPHYEHSINKLHPHFVPEIKSGKFTGGHLSLELNNKTLHIPIEFSGHYETTNDHGEKYTHFKFEVGTSIPIKRIKHKKSFKL